MGNDMVGRQALGAALGSVRSRLARGHRMTPGYLVVGTKRGGSTSLADWIAAHPQVGPCATGKGTHYFDVNHGRGRGWFDAQFPRVDAGFRITGESSPYYMFHPRSPRWIADELPDAKIVVCLRDPVERAWSHHAYEVSRGHETEAFDRALDLEPERLQGEAERLAADPTYAADHWRYHAYLRRGHYAEQVATFHALMGPERVLVVQSEALFADPDGEMARVHAFLGLDPHRTASPTALNAGAAKQAMPQTVRARLEAYYAPLNEALYALPGVSFRWSGPSVPAATVPLPDRAGTGAA